MKYHNDRYRFTIKKNNQYTLFSTDNKPYDFIYHMREYSRNSFICAYEINIESDDKTVSVALIGRAYGCVDNCAVLYDDRLAVLVDEWLVFLDLSDYCLIRKVEILMAGTGIALYSFDDGLLVHGELDIIKVDYNGNVEWSFSGRDIWVTTDDMPAVCIENDTIQLVDFNGDTYIVDRDGKQIG